VSSKGRKKVENNEFYPTDRRVVYSLMETDLIDLPGGWWIEPCAGTGRIVEAVNEGRDDVRWLMTEINEWFEPYLRRIRREQDCITEFEDFVTMDWPYGRASVAIFNPPFSLTLEFIKAAMDRADWVVCLQRQGWFGTKDRSPWLRAHCPDVLQLPFRPSFRPDGKTDSIEYAWFVFPPGCNDGRRSGKIGMLDRPKNGQVEMF
jgi:hypothetical protein